METEKEPIFGKVWTYFFLCCILWSCFGMVYFYKHEKNVANNKQWLKASAHNEAQFDSIRSYYLNLDDGPYKDSIGLVLDSRIRLIEKPEQTIDSLNPVVVDSVGMAAPN